VSGLLWDVVACEGESFCGLGLGVVCALWLRRLRSVRWVLLVGLVRSCMRLVTYSSSSPVMTYLRWDRESDSACCWVCVRVGMRPWYMVVMLVRSMCIPHVQPSVCWGVLCIWVTGVVCCRSGGAVSSHVYHCRRVLCIMWIAGGGRRLRESK
jgi:hypothetical protein